jgi:lipopolysaccharide transport system permease protein
MVSVIDGFRWSILRGQTTIYLPGFLISVGIGILFLIIGITYFRKMEKSFADVI